MKANIIVLVYNRLEYTNIMCYHLYKYTDFDLVNKLIFVNDGSTDGADRVCQSWCDLKGIGKVINIDGGNVTRATYEGLKYLDQYPTDYIIKLDNDFIVSEAWLNIAIRTISMNKFNVVGFKPSLDNTSWDINNSIRNINVGHTGGIFISDTDTMDKYRFTTSKAEVGLYDYTYTSYSDMIYSKIDTLKIGVFFPALPMFSLDRQAFQSWDNSNLMLRGRLNPERMAELSRKYQDEKFSRISVGPNRIKPKKINIKGRV